MADTFTAIYNLTKPEVGASRDTWGQKYNANLDKIDAAVKANADAAAAAKSAADAARGVADAAVPKSGGTVPYFEVKSEGDNNLTWTRLNGGATLAQWRGVVAADKTFYIHSITDNKYFGFSPTGDLYLPIMGGTALSVAIANAAAAANVRVAKSGDTMTGQLIIKYNYPGLELRASDTGGFPYIDFTNEAANNVDFAWRLMTYGKTSDGFIFAGPGGDNKFIVGQDGALWTKQFGDLNARIEARGSAWADNAAARCVMSMRMVYIADMDITAGYNGGVQEYYGGSCVTGRASIISGDQNDIILRSMRFRQNQIYIPNQGWVAAYFA